MPRRAPTIRQWLALLLAAFIMPATLAVLALSLHSYQRERAAIERANLDVARALVQAVDLELVSARAALQALATSPSLDRNDLRSFHAQAIAVLRDRPGNVVVLTDRGLQQLDNSGKPREAPLPAHGNPDAVRHVFASARSAVSDLYHAPTVRRLLASVDVPVMRDGRVRWVLSMQYDGERLGSILARQRLPAGVSAAIYDGAARVIWGSGGQLQAGSPAGAALVTGLALGPEGIVEETGDGADRVVMFSRSSATPWYAQPRSCTNGPCSATKPSVPNAGCARPSAWSSAAKPSCAGSSRKRRTASFWCRTTAVSCAPTARPNACSAGPQAHWPGSCWTTYCSTRRETERSVRACVTRRSAMAWQATPSCVAGAATAACSRPTPWPTCCPSTRS